MKPATISRDDLDASLVEGPVPQLLIKLSLPMIVGLVAMMSYNAVDTFFVAHLGVQQLAAMTFTFPVAMSIISVAIGLGAGASSCVARAVGEGNKDRARRLITDCLLLCLLMGVAISAVGLRTIEPLFLRLGADPSLLPLIADYMRPWYWGAAFMIAPMVATSLLRALGNSKLSGIFLVAGALFNLALDPLLIFGLAGFPRLELQGAAIATLVVRIVSFILAAGYVLYKGWLSNPFRHLHLLIDSWRRLLHVGLPAMATNVIIPLASGVVVAMVAKYGEAAIAGMGVAVRVEPLALIFFYAMSAVIGPFCGQNLGAGLHDRLRKSLRFITVFSLISGLVLALLLAVLARPLVAAFTDSAEALAVGVNYLLIVPLSFGCYGLVMSVNAAFNGIGKPLPGTVISVLRVLGVYLPLALFLERFFGLRGLFIATACSNILVGGLAFLWLRRTYGRLGDGTRDEVVRAI